MALMGPHPRLLTVDGRRADGTAAMRELLAGFLAQLRTAQHEVTAQWHQDDAWIAEVDASYELRDFLQQSGRPRAFVVREGPGGISDIRVYGAHEQPLSEHRTREEGMWIGTRWIPPL